MSAEPEVCVIVLNMDGEDLLKDCLKAISENTLYPDDSYDIVVSDNDSDDGSVEVAREAGASVIENGKNLGFSAANNVAIAENPGYDYYLLLNNDTEPGEGWLAALVETGEENPGAGIIGPKLLLPDGSIQSAGLRLPELDNYREGRPSESLSGTSEEEGVLGASFMIKAEVIDDIGYLDELFSMIDHEESDYCMRARAAGHSVLLEPSSEVIHKEWGAKGEGDGRSPFAYLMDVKNRMKFQIMNGNAKTLLGEAWEQAKHLGGAFIGYKNNSIRRLLFCYREVLMDLLMLLRKRFDRTAYIPSCYHERIKDYTERYEGMG